MLLAGADDGSLPGELSPEALTAELAGGTDAPALGDVPLLSELIRPGE
jgi:hypothetical protein